MIRTCLRLLRHTITANRIDFTSKQLAKNPVIDFLPVVGIRERKLGACVLNQPSNQNLLTEEFVDELYRFLLSYQFDSTVENVWIQSKELVFSHGLDFKRLSEDKHYLDKTAKLAILVASLSKPIFAQVAGGAKGAGAYLLSMLHMPLGYPTAFLKLDECSRGMVPLMGGTHRLARLPMHLGAYLALSSDELNAEEMAQLGLLRGQVCEGVTNSQIRRRFHEANLLFRDKFRYMDFDQDEALLEGEQKDKVDSNKQRYYSELKYAQTELLTAQPRNLNLRFAVNQHLATSVDYENATAPFSSFSEQTSGRRINNYTAMRLDRPLHYLQEHKLVRSFRIRGVELKRLDLAKIDRIFGLDTLEQVLQALKNDDSPWARKTLERIRAADPLAARLTFQLIRQAEGLPWVSCLQNEFTVARKLLRLSQLSLRTYKKSSHYVFSNPHSSTPAESLPQALVDSFFTVQQPEEQLEHSVAPNSLLPACDYFRDVPDSVRAYLNRTPFVDKHNSEQVPEVLRFLNAHSINYKSQVFDVDLLRQKVYQRLEVMKEKERLQQRLNYLASHDQELQRYLGQRQKYLQSVSDGWLADQVEEELKRTFQQKLEGRFEAFEDKTAKLVGLENRIGLFKRVKDIILEGLLSKGAEYEEGKKGSADYVGPIYFDPQGRDIYSSNNPHLAQDQALSQLTADLSKGTALSEEFAQFDKDQMPTFFGIPEFLLDREQKDREMWERIKFRYDERPELWAEAYTYRELIEQASRTSEDIAGYLDWSFQNFYDLLDGSEQLRTTYGEFASDMQAEVTEAREQRLQKLRQVEAAREKVLRQGLFSQAYQFRGEGKMRQIFPYFFKEAVIPAEFRRCFLSTLDSTLSELMGLGKERRRSGLLLNEELGIFDRWLNQDIAEEYTTFLKHDVEYVTSYLQILFVKDMLHQMGRLKQERRPSEEMVQLALEKYQVDFDYYGQGTTFETMEKAITGFLYFLVDMHSQAKQRIQSPQAKLIDFLNRLKTSYDFDQDRAAPFSFEGLLLLIARDRSKIYHRAHGLHYVAEPEFLLKYLNREAKRAVQDIYSPESDVRPREVDQGIRSHGDHLFQWQPRNKRLIQNYFYYMMEFEKQIKKVCGNDAFLPHDFVPQQLTNFNQHTRHTIARADSPQWLTAQVRQVVHQLLHDRQTAEQTLTKGELHLYDEELQQQLQPSFFRLLLQQKLTEEVFLVRNIFQEERDSGLEPRSEEEADLEYTRVKRTARNPDALKKMNNLNISEQVFQEYMHKYTTEGGSDNMSLVERRFAEQESHFSKNGFATRLPFKSYHRMARDVFVYPQEMVSVPSTPRELQLFKKINMRFQTSLSGERIHLSPFISQYRQLQASLKDTLLDEMVDKIQKVEQL